MPHYVVQSLDPEKYFIYSTVVDGQVHPKTGTLNQQEMSDYLAGNGYESWLEASPQEFMYWNGQFCYVKEKDCYYTLPRELWRNGKR